MQDIRVLTLYKQHYMDRYTKKLCSEYSCWGYYDGMDIAKADSGQHGSLLMENLSASISDLWYKSGEIIGNMNGHYGSINIGLFRYAQQDAIQATKEFWEQKDRMPFFGISFLQLELDSPTDYHKISDNIECKINFGLEKICNVITYCTYDNADLVLLISSNSLTIMEQRLQVIDAMPEVRYQHSVLGVSEQYLTDCKSGEKMLGDWRGTRCFIEEPVSRLDIRLVSSGERQIINIEKNILGDTDAKYKLKGYEDATYSYVSGHENLVFSLRNTDVRTMLVLLLPGGFATHQNESYQKRRSTGDKKQLQPRLFNIETSYVLDSGMISNVSGSVEDSEFSLKDILHNWFQNKIDEYKIRLRDALEDGDESLYSYYLALIRTFNVLSQYERFSLSEDIFYLLYPSFKMFDEKLTCALNEVCANVEKNEYDPNLSVIKQSMSEFLESVNSVIYHTIHTDQVYLMVPGYSGTSFSIPIKLNMVFLWFTDCVARILGNNGRKYRCILVPTMEATPVTHWIRLERNQESFLVCVKLSQRTLYMPKSFMIILAHEMGHYIGGDPRSRKLRSEKLKEFVVSKLVSIIFGESNRKDEFGQKLRAEFGKVAEERIKSYLDKLKDKGFYGDDVEKILKSACRCVLSECRSINSHNLIKVYNELKIEEQKKFVQMNDFLDMAEFNAMNALWEDTMNKVIADEMKIYREIFSDLVAIRLLSCNKKDFDEAYRVSEGMDIRGEEIERRGTVMCAFGGDIGWEKEKTNLSRNDELLCEYLAKCNAWLDDRLHNMKDESRELLEEIRRLYQNFAAQDGKERFSGDCKVYDEILRCIDKMKQDIDNDIQKEAYV